MKKAVRKTLGISLLALGIGAAPFGTAMADEAVDDFFYSTPFDNCFYYGYDSSKVSGHQAYETAECFNTLINEPEGQNVGASKLTLLRYASIWYGIAAASGVAEAQAKLASSDEALRIHVKAQEASKSGKLEASLTELDINQDGVVSLAEYTVAISEATASGK